MAGPTRQSLVFTTVVGVILWQLTLPENQSGLARRNAAIAIAITGTCAAWNWWLVRCVKYVVTPNEIIQLRRRHRWRRIKWKDVEMVSVSTGFDVRARDGRRIHVPYVVVGQKDFASEVLANVPRTRIDCLHVLEETLRE